MSLSEWVARYNRAGLATLPIAGGAKAPPAVGDGWLEVAPAEQWRALGPSWGGNIALLCGGGTLALDCDAPSTEAYVLAYLKSLGVQGAPHVRTPHGGLHVWLHCQDVPSEVKVKRLAVGPGELRAHRCYVMAPPSFVDGQRYRFIRGRPEQIPTVKWHDLDPLVNPCTPEVHLETPPVPLLKRPLPRKAEADLALLAYPKPRLEGGLTRSEVEASIVAQLILAGWELGEIQGLFRERRPGHYREHRNPTAYLEQTYHNVLDWLAAQGDRPALAALYQEALSWPWPGRTGLHDRAVYLALIALAWQTGTSAPYASLRDLALLSAKGVHGVDKALYRLAQAGLIHRRPNEGETARWEIPLPHTCGGVSNGNISHSIGTIRGTYTVTVSEPGAGAPGNEPASAEVWGVLGRSCEAIYRALGGEAKTVTDLAKVTGRSRCTVYRALNRLGTYGLARRVGGGWALGERPFAEVSAELDAEGRHRLRRAAFEHQREAYHKLRQARACRPPVGAPSKVQGPAQGTPTIGGDLL